MNIFIKVLVCFIAGAGAGIGTGFAGMSAAAVIGPVLATFLGLPPYQAIGIGLASDVLASFISAYTYKKHGNLDVKNSLPLLLSVLVMTVAGSLVASMLPDRTMGSFSQFGMLIIGLKFLIKPNNATKQQMTEMTPKQRIIRAIIGGVLVGFICGFVGAGGGMMLLFVLTSFLGYEMHMAVGTSVFIMAFTALTGGISHFAIGGMPDLGSLILCVLFTLVWARIAAVLANKASTKTLNQVVGIVMVVTSIFIIAFNMIF
ncbi:MAG: sulfite exporter TauE/SafE family protein [Erysipelotrichaceae bacterium]|nr:sulfite exporter TauE/SafE family protein [Erysipelotrichaceae bacterium]